MSQYKYKMLTALCGFALVMLMVGCTTTKKKEDLSKLGMLYQNMTAHYNGYFNATEIMKESELTLTTQYKDNFNQILPVFAHNAVDDPKSVASELDEAIKKASVVISLHRPSKWTDDCYLLIGQAQYMKQDYESAQKTLEYMINNFDEKGNSREKVSNAKPSKAQAKAERLRRIKEKTKEIEARKKEQAKNRKERNEEIKTQKKEQAKKRKSDQKVRDDINKERQKTRKKANNDRKKNNKSNADRRKEYNDNLKEKQREKEKEQKAAEKAREEARKLAQLEGKPPVKAEVKKEGKEKAPIKQTENNKPEEDKKKKDKKKKDKKEKEDKVKDGAFAHIPAYQHGVLWLAKTYVERDFLIQADRLFRQVEKTKSRDKQLMKSLYPSMAHYYIYTKEYQKAIPALESAIETTSKRALKARYSYIIGQLKMKNGTSAEAIAYFDQAAKWSSDYEMEFNAKMSSTLASLSSGTSSDAIAKELEKLLKDEKNDEYKDQIYFQIAKVYLEDNNLPKAEEYLKLALENVGSNSAQKGEIHYTLGEIYYTKDMFDKSHENYVLAAGVLKETDDRKAYVDNQISKLAEIAKHLNALTLQDSLLMLASLSDEELKTRANEILKTRNEKLEAAKEKMSEKIKGPISTRLLSSTVPLATSNSLQSSFFAYNEKELRKGEREFAKNWGSRPLVDNWRTVESGESTIISEDDEGEIVISKEATKKEVENIFKNLPRTEEQQSQAKLLIADALYALGMEYRNKLERLELSTSAFTRFVNEYSDDDRVPEALYFLYLNAKDQNDVAAMTRYANQITTLFPDSKYALIIKDPSYIDELLSNVNSVDAYYEATYESFQNGNYQEVHDAFDKASSKFGLDNQYISKFALLRSMTVGKLKGKAEYIESLRSVIAQYPNTAEQIRAREIIRFLNGEDGAFTNDWDQPLILTSYKTEFDKLHYVVVALYNEDVVSSKEAKSTVNNYNNVFHKLEKLSIRSFIVNRDKKSSAILVRKFDDKNGAMKYVEEVEGRLGEFLPPKTDAEVYAISQFNYREMIKSGGIESYKQFFQDHYRK